MAYILYNTIGDLNEIKDKLTVIYDLIKRKYMDFDFRDFYFWKRQYNKKVFELMDTKEYPSMSDKLDLAKEDIRIAEPILDINNELIIREVKTIDDDLSVFDLPSDKFIEAISVCGDSSDYLVEKMDNDVSIIEDFCD